MNRGYRIRNAAVSILILLSLCLLLAIPALADNESSFPDGIDYMFKLYESFDYNSSDPNERDYFQALSELKAQLEEKGYYGRSATKDDTAQIVTYDEATHNAILKMCEENGISFPEGARPLGLPKDTWLDITDRKDSIRDLNVEDDPSAGMALIVWEQSGENVYRLQERLILLGYLDEFEKNESGSVYYHHQMRDAVNRFLEVNTRFGSYDQVAAQGISPELQDFILNSDLVLPNPTPTPEPVITPEPTPEPGFSQRMRGHLTSSNKQLHVPNYVLWIAGLVIVVLIVLAVIYFFVPSHDDEAKTGRTRRRKGSSQVVEFTITYGDKTEMYTCVISKVLHIGRNVGSFPLDLTDADLSRRHCELYYLNDRLMLRDYSTNGTRVNDRLVSNSEVQLNSGDTLIIGHHRITVAF